MTGLRPRISRLGLENFRSYAELDLRVESPIVALVGENGAGKTNVLEALSLFATGRGLRRADLPEMVRGGAPRFGISISAGGAGDEPRRFGIRFDSSETGRGGRSGRIDGAPVASAASFAEHLRIVWLTPDLDGLFRGPGGDRRRFLDRLVLAIDPRHGARVSALERALRSRNRLLGDNGDPAWLDAVESELSELAIAIASARRETSERLAAECRAGWHPQSPFPYATVSLGGEIDGLVASLPAVDAEDRYRAILRSGRARDAAAGRTLVGPQASEFTLGHGPKNRPAGECSTGEQKAVLIGVVLAHARLVAAMSGIAPIVLLDEVAAHLDPRRRSALFEIVGDLGGQVWLTGADPAAFTELAGRSDRFQIRDGTATPIR